MAKTISAKDEDFNREQRIIVDRTAQNVAYWSIPEPWFSSTLLSARVKWETAYTAYNADPNERTRNMTYLKNKAREEYEPLVRQLVTVLVGSPVVTDADLESMGIAGRRTGKHFPHVPVPEDVPDARIEQALNHRLIMHYHAHDRQKESSVAKPHGVRGAEIAWALLENPPASYDDLVKRDFDTASPYTFSFDIPDAGKTLYVSLRWENTRGEKGPWSEIMSAVIP